MVDRCDCGFGLPLYVSSKGRAAQEHRHHHDRWLNGVRIGRRGLEAAFDTAAGVYQKECRLDFPPVGWLGERELDVRGDRLVGFALALQEGEDAFLEHLSVCAQMRRSGVATEIVSKLATKLGQTPFVCDVTAAAPGWLESAERIGIVRRWSYVRRLP